jgi:hypothetical protein
MMTAKVKAPRALTGGRRAAVTCAFLATKGGHRFALWCVYPKVPSWLHAPWIKLNAVRQPAEC